MDRAAMRKARDVSVGDRLMVIPVDDGFVHRASRGDRTTAVAATVLSLHQMESERAIAIRTTSGILRLMTRLSVLALPAAEGAEADQRLVHGLSLLRHGAALVTPEVEWLPVGHDGRRALVAALEGIEAMVREFENAYDLPTIP